MDNKFNVGDVVYVKSPNGGGGLKVEIQEIVEGIEATCRVVSTGKIDRYNLDDLTAQILPELNISYKRADEL